MENYFKRKVYDKDLDITYPLWVYHAEGLCVFGFFLAMIGLVIDIIKSI